MNENLTTALEAYKPEIAARFESFVRNIFARMVEDLGPSLKGIHNSYRWVRTFNGTVRPFIRHQGESGTARIDSPYILNEDALKAGAAEYAEQVVESWAGKITAKMGELDNAEVRSMGDCSFNITGTKQSKSVQIEQTMIVNMSSKGTLFNQFPARIYVEGKFVSEAKFRKLAA